MQLVVSAGLILVFGLISGKGHAQAPLDLDVGLRGGVETSGGNALVGGQVEVKMLNFRFITSYEYMAPEGGELHNLNFEGQLEFPVAPNLAPFGGLGFNYVILQPDATDNTTKSGYFLEGGLRLYLGRINLFGLIKWVKITGLELVPGSYWAVMAGLNFNIL